MGIKVICQTTGEREAETQKLFEQVKPLLDDGYSYNRAVRVVKQTKTSYVSHYRWFKDLLKYGESQGYPYKDYQTSKRRIL